MSEPLRFRAIQWGNRTVRVRKGRANVLLAVDGADSGSKARRIRERFPGRKLARFGRFAHLEDEADQDGGSALNVLKSPELKEAVSFAEPDILVEGLQEVVPDFTQNPGDGSAWQWGMPLMGMEEAWKQESGRDHVFIALVDSGIEDHANLDAGRFCYGGSYLWNEVPDVEFALGAFSDDQAAREAVLDLQGHGLSMAGILASGPPGTGVAGMNWSTPVGICRALDQYKYGSASSVVASVLRALDHVATTGQRLVVNLSLTASDVELDKNAFAIGEDPGEVLSFAYLAETVRNAGGIMVCGAGNGMGEIPKTPAAYALKPEFADTVVAVGYTRLDNGVEVTANDARQGVSVVAPGHFWPVIAGHANYKDSWGTSIATAHVSGLVSLIWSRNPTLSPGDVIGILKNTADLNGPAETWGAGRINAAAALAATPPGT